MDEYTAYLAEALEQAETKEEQKAIIAQILKRRPMLYRLFAELLAMEPQEQAQTVHLYNEMLKPHTGKAS